MLFKEWNVLLVDDEPDVLTVSKLALKVIDEYDISGYLTKVDATEQKLYTLIKSGIRQWYSIFYGKLMADITHSAILSAETKEQLWLSLRQSGDGVETSELITGIIFEGSDVLTYSPVEHVFSIRDELERMPALMTTEEGYKLVVDGPRVLVHIHDSLPPSQKTWVGYRGYLSQILLNLLTNIERYTYAPGAGGVADITLTLQN